MASGPPAPFSWPPSQYWDDINGPWSSFALRVGSQEQIVRVLVSTASQATWVVLPSGCQAPSCNPSSRGGTFNALESMTRNATGIYPLGVELNLNYDDTGAYGLDTVALGFSRSIGGPPLDSQVVVGIETYNYYTGMFGLGSQPTNFTDFSEPHPSFLSTLKSKKLIPSLSWGYTAGAHYRLKGVYGSLTLGGYDRSRIVPNDVPFHLAPDQSRDLVVVLHSIVSQNSTLVNESLLAYPIYIFIDSTLPYIYLPLETCKQFERTFGLIWDPLADMYTVDEQLHMSLQASNPSFTFTVGDSTSGLTVDIVLPYASFDLLASPPLVRNDTRYFPLLRADNDTQYTLGRTFLQEAYLVTNYEYSNFSIFQTKFEDGRDKDIVSIPARSSSTVAISHHRNRALEIGVGVGTLAILVLSLLVVAFFTQKRRAASRKKPIRGVTQLSASIDDANNPSIIAVQEIEDNRLYLYKEMADSGIVELLHEPPPFAELPGSGPNIKYASTRTRQLARNPATNSFTKRFATYLSTGSMIENWMKQTKNAEPPGNKKNCDSMRTSSFPDLNRALPPTPDSESVHFSWIMRNIVLARQSGSQGITSSDVDGVP